MLLPIVWCSGIVEESLKAINLYPNHGTCYFRLSSFHLNLVQFVGIALLVLHFFMPMISIPCLYVHMLSRLNSTNNSKFHSTLSQRNNVMEKAVKNIFKTMLLVTMYYGVCYSFSAVYSTLFLFRTIQSLAGKSCFRSFIVILLLFNRKF